MEYKLCHDCAIVFTNGDDSHLTPEGLAIVESFARSVGLLAYVEDDEEEYFFECECCHSKLDLTKSHLFETIEDI